MQIIHILPRVNISGGITLLQKILLNLPKHIKHQIWASKLDQDIYFHQAQLFITNHSQIRYFPKILKRLKKEEKDKALIHIHGRNGFFVFLAAKITNFKVIYQPHGYYYKLSRRKLFFFFQNLVDNYLLKFSDFILFTSDGERDFALKNYNVNKNYKVIYNRSDSVKKKINIPTSSEKLSLIYCLATSGIYQKGLDRQLLLLNQLRKLKKNFKLIHYFNFENKYELKILNNRIKSLNLSNHYFLKNTSKNVWNEINSTGGIIISTSRYEGRNLVIQESFHNMVPVVATNCIGQKELLKESHAFVLKGDKINEWTHTLLEALSNREIRNIKAKRASKWIKQFGDMKTYSNELLKCYKFVEGL